MKRASYDLRRPMFWIVTLMAITLFGHALLTFARSGFSHWVRNGTYLGVLSAIWGIYFGVARDLRAAHGQIADTLSIRVEISVGWCCILGYLLAISTAA